MEVVIVLLHMSQGLFGLRECIQYTLLTLRMCQISFFHTSLSRHRLNLHPLLPVNYRIQAYHWLPSLIWIN